VRIGVGHPGSKDLVHGYVLHDFAKADAEWLDPLLDAIAGAAGRLAAGDPARFLTDVARSLKDTEREEPKREAAEPERKGVRGARSEHPAGERQAKRTSALADSLKRWLKGRKQES
jgi:PTH1 family peptidyl-tRNA hydrolase